MGRSKYAVPHRKPPFYLTGHCRPVEAGVKPEYGTCPRCTMPLPLYMGAISRYDDKTELCSGCGFAEFAEVLRG